MLEEDMESLDYEGEPSEEGLQGYNVSEIDTPEVSQQDTAQTPDASEQTDSDSELDAAADTSAVRAVAPAGRQPIPAPVRAAKQPARPKVYDYLAENAELIKKVDSDRKAAAASAACAAAVADTAAAATLSISMPSGPFSGQNTVYDITSASGRAMGVGAVLEHYVCCKEQPTSVMREKQAAASEWERGASCKLLQSAAASDPGHGQRISIMLQSSNSPCRQATQFCLFHGSSTHYTHECKSLALQLAEFRSSGDSSVLRASFLTNPAAALKVWDVQQGRHNRAVARKQQQHRLPPLGRNTLAGRGGFQKPVSASQFVYPGAAQHRQDSTAAAGYGYEEYSDPVRRFGTDGPCYEQYRESTHSFGAAARAGVVLPPLRTRVGDCSPVWRPPGLADRMDFRVPMSDAATAGWGTAPPPPASSRSSGSAASGFISLAEHHARVQEIATIAALAAATASIQVEQQVSRAHKKRYHELERSTAEQLKKVFRGGWQ
jgi:hypothetical protein